MFALSFRFPVGRYHATPWGRNVNEADVAWPPEPWRLLRMLIATYWRKGDHVRWSEEDLARLIDKLAETLPKYRLPEGAIHAHTRHYMPIGVIGSGREKTTLVFDAFLRLPADATLVACWRGVTLEPKLFSLAKDLAEGVGYLGRAESWTECEALDAWDGKPNCQRSGASMPGDPVRLIAPLSPNAYSTERQRIIDDLKCQISATKPTLKKRAVNAKLDRELTSRSSRAHTLPERLVDALALDTADYKDRGWSRPPAAREVVYTRASKAAPSVTSGRLARYRPSRRRRDPTVARFLLVGRPRPRIEDAVKIGELMRLAARAQFLRKDETWDARVPRVPWEVSGLGTDRKPLKDPSHSHAFWLPEDADGDGWIDHVSVFVASGMSDDIRTELDGITRLWLPRKQRLEEAGEEHGSAKEWRLALEGFGKPADFADGARIFATSRRWCSVTPFLSAGYLKSSGYAGEVRRLLRRRGMDATGVEVEVLESITVGGTERRNIHYHRFRSRGREVQRDAAGALLDIVFPVPHEGPLAIGFGSHFGLGLFAASDT